MINCLLLASYPVGEEQKYAISMIYVWYKANLYTIFEYLFVLCRVFYCFFLRICMVFLRCEEYIQKINS